MKQLRALVVASVFLLGLSTAHAAPDWIEYSPREFGAAQEAGETILVDVTADWCPTCKAQLPILDELRAEEGLQDVVFVQVDFDTHKEFLRQHRVPRQSTILIFEGRTEVGRSIAETDRDRLRRFVFQAVGH